MAWGSRQFTDLTPMLGHGGLLVGDPVTRDNAARWGIQEVRSWNVVGDLPRDPATPIAIDGSWGWTIPDENGETGPDAYGTWTRPDSWQGMTAASVSHSVTPGSGECLATRARITAGNVTPWSSQRCTFVDGGAPTLDPGPAAPRVLKYSRAVTGASASGPVTPPGRSAPGRHPRAAVPCGVLAWHRPRRSVCGPLALASVHLLLRAKQRLIVPAGG